MTPCEKGPWGKDHAVFIIFVDYIYIFFSNKQDLKKYFQIRFAVRAVPTFIFLKGGQVLATVRGGNKEQLESKLKEISLSANQKPPEGAPPGMADLSSLIDKVKMSTV